MPDCSPGSAISYQRPNYEPVECSGLPSQSGYHTWERQAQGSPGSHKHGLQGHLYLILSPKHRARSNPVQGQQGRVNRNSSMGQAHASENKTLLHHTHSYRPGFPHLLVWCCSDCCSGTGWDVIQFQKQSWGQAGFGGQVKNLHPCLFSPLILSVVEIQTRLVLLITFLPCWFTPQQILLLWKSNMASEQSVQSDWSQLLFPEFKT